ncbi:MAG: 50S ribosomal protein L10 [Thermoanaerobaculia bacterium]
MAISRERKQELVELYENGLAKAPHVFLIGFEGISVPDVTELRNQVRETGATYVVVKNRLAMRAIEGAGLESLREQFQGTTAAAFGLENPVAIAKAVSEFAKKVPAIELKGGIVDGQQVAAEEIEAIASLPSREELIAKLLFLMQSPITSFVRTLNELQRQFVVVMDQVRQEKEKGADG